MSNTKQNLKDAIAEAKTIRETALAQAKLALEEAFTPQLQSMLAAKLNEIEVEEDVYEGKKAEEAEDSMEETLDLEALLAEADDEEESEEEAPAEKEAGEEKGEDEEQDITEMTPEEVEDYIRQIAAEEFEKLETAQGEELPGEEGEDLEIDTEEAPAEDMPADGEEINLDEMMDDMTDEEKIDENDINIDELLAEFGLSEEEEVEEGYGKDDDLKSKMEEELAQALSTIDELRSSLQEVNLLNAKLLYMNKVFKGHNLTESQKIQVVKTFDKAESAKEAKLVFESLTSTLTKKEIEKTPIKESLGFASKASGIIAGASSNKVIDSDAQMSRWAKLAGLQ
jgi:hypothetical protein